MYSVGLLSLQWISLLIPKPLTIMLVFVTRLCIRVRFLGAVKLYMIDCPLWPAVRKQVVE